MTSSNLVALSLAVLATLAPASAAAINPDAQTLFAEGRNLRRAGDCERAIAAFRQALASAPEGLGALRNIAECEEQLGRYASARSDWSVLRRAVRVSTEARYDGWDKDAEAGYLRLEGKVGKLVVRLRGDDLAGVTVTVDGQPLDPGLLGAEVERDPGSYTVEASRASGAPVVETRALVAGGREEVTLLVPPPAPAQGTTRPRGDAGGRAMRNAGFVAIGAGGLGLIGTVAAVVVRQSALSSLEQACPGYAMGQVCPSSVRGASDAGRTASTVASVFGAMAVAGLGVGIPLAAVGSRQSSAPAVLGASATAGGAAAWATLRF